ncbi:MAG: ChbG/HpnK family deacetylase [Lachnospiraceae bacterium]|nr:ChbG/HpnK family deacetylase [Lachnospiraceae bacterium]
MIEFHADDYGMTEASSRRIIECINEGCINGISLMANSPHLEECMEILYREAKKQPMLAIHLNLITERALGTREETPSLTDEDGYFNQSYLKLFLASLIPFERERIRREIHDELLRQIRRCLPYFPGKEQVRIDSHRHVHMIPMVFDELSRIIEEEGLQVSYVRITREKPQTYEGIRGFTHFRPVNLIKVLLLNAFARVNRMRHRELYECGRSDFASILFSGCMTWHNLSRVLNNIRLHRTQYQENIEIMMHPGAVLEAEDLKQFHDKEDFYYMSDPMRMKEAEAAKKVWSLLKS